VYFLPAAVDVDPTFLQAVPAFTAENAGVERTEDRTISETTVATRLFINQDYLAPLDLSAIPLEWEVIQAQEVLAGLEQGKI